MDAWLSLFALAFFFSFFFLLLCVFFFHRCTLWSEKSSFHDSLQMETWMGLLPNLVQGGKKQTTHTHIHTHTHTYIHTHTHTHTHTYIHTHTPTYTHTHTPTYT